MRLLFALCFFLPVAILAQIWFTRKSTALQSGSARSLLLTWPPQESKAPLLAIVLCIVVATTVAGGIWAERNFLFDDSFISYRYARNLADGHGLVWNTSGPHTEGYTNLLLVLIAALTLRLGADPLSVVRIISLLCALAIAVLIFGQARRIGASRSVSVILGLGVFTFSTTTELSMLGLETVMFSAAILACFACSERFFQTGANMQLVWAGTLAFIAVLLRPEVLLLVLSISAAALLSREMELRSWLRMNGILALAFGIPLTLYVAWKIWYFGSAIPNPALVKMPGDNLVSPLGMASIGWFMDSNSRIVLLAGLGLFFQEGRRRTILTCALLVTMFLLFYLRVDTLMDYAQRFLYPAVPFLLVIALPVLKRLVEAVLDWRQVPVIQLAGGCLLFILVFYQYPGYAMGRIIGRPGVLGSVESREIHQASLTLKRMGLELGTYDQIRSVRLGSTDAGLLPYFSQIQHVDMAGLNTRFLAESRDVTRSADYFFSQNLDLIILRARIGGTLVDYEHGILGDYPKWANHPGWNHFFEAGAIHNGPRHDLYFFVRTDSPHRIALEKIIRERLADVSIPRLQVSMGTR